VVKKLEGYREIDDLRGLDAQQIKKLKKAYKKRMKHFEQNFRRAK
jgi:hypothetical protein